MKRIIPIVLILLAAACGGDTAETTTTTAAPSGDDTATTATTTTTVATTTTTAPTTTTTAAPSADECVVGTWELNSEAFVEVMNERMEGEVPGEVTVGGGTYQLVMDEDGTFAVTRDDWRWVVESQEGSFVIQVSGTETGTYEIDGDSITAATTGGETTVQTGVLVDGELQDLPFPIEMDFEADAVTGSGTFECTDDMLTVTIEGFDSVFRR